MTAGAAVVFVEGASDRAALEALAARRGLDLAAARVEIVAVGGAHALGRALGERSGVRVAGIYDLGEERAILAALARAGIAPDGFFACDPDLEGELVRALGPERMLALVAERGRRSAFETYRRQPAKRALSLEAQLHGWLHNWKVEYAAPLVDALHLDRVPRPLDAVLAYALGDAGRRTYVSST